MPDEDATLCPRCGSTETHLLMRTMLRIFHFCREYGKTFMILALSDPREMTARQRNTFW